MRFLILSIVTMFGAIALFIMGTLWGSSFLMLTMCPSSIAFIWLNGFAFNRAGITISANPQQKKVRQAPQKRQQQNRVEYS